MAIRQGLFMPSLNFILPHWLYWACLLIFPAIAIVFVRRQRARAPGTGPSLFVAYLFWLTAGFIGIHRFYLRNMWGFLFFPIFGAILYFNSEIRDAREVDSRTHAAVGVARSAFGQEQSGNDAPPPQPAAGASPGRAEIAGSAGSALKASEREYAVAHADLDHQRRNASYAAILLATMLLIDAALLPGLVRRRREKELDNPALDPVHHDPPLPVHSEGGTDPTRQIHTRVTDGIEWLTVRIGEYVAYWAILSVFVYYYEVIARFVFNSPTNWVHESMFLMFGMQYMLCGAYAYREDQHVRVDVVYAKFSPRGKAAADLFTSIFFFIFIGTMLWTGGRFALDSINFNEHSFTEWGIEYWPVKLSIPIGAALLLLQGLARLIKDVRIVTQREA
jgi:TRAP-type mannitol/chloroaromatic compound transport system permease small subunit